MMIQAGRFLLCFCFCLVTKGLLLRGSGDCVMLGDRTRGPCGHASALAPLCLAPSLVLHPQLPRFDQTSQDLFELVLFYFVLSAVLMGNS